MPTITCGGCSGTGREPVDPAVPTVVECEGCGGLIGSCLEQDLTRFVVREWHRGPEPSEARYVDIMIFAPGRERRFHGWIDPATKRIVQTG